MLIYSFDSNSGIYAPTGSSITQYQITKTTSQDNIRFFIGYDLVNGNYDTIIDWIKIYKGEQKALMDDIYPQSEFFTFSGNTIDIFLPSGITRFATPGELGIALTLKDVDNKYDTYNVRIGEIVKNWDAKEYNKFEF
jgi:hypothetical protein